MTPERLAEIRNADARVRIEVDQYGGQYVQRRDVGIYGPRAILHRRELLAEIDRLHLLEQRDPPGELHP